MQFGEKEQTYHGWPPQKCADKDRAVKMLEVTGAKKKRGKQDSVACDLEVSGLQRPEFSLGFWPLSCDSD